MYTLLSTAALALFAHHRHAKQHTHHHTAATPHATPRADTLRLPRLSLADDAAPQTPATDAAAAAEPPPPLRADAASASAAVAPPAANASAADGSTSAVPRSPENATSAADSSPATNDEEELDAAVLELEQELEELLESMPLAWRDEVYRASWSDLGLPMSSFPLADEALPSGDELQALCDEVFGLDSFVVSEVDALPLGLVFRGSLRKASVSSVSALVQSRLAASAYADKVMLFLLPAAVIGSVDEEEAADELEAALLSPFDEEVPPPPVEYVYLALPRELETDACAGQPAAATASWYALSAITTVAFALGLGPSAAAPPATYDASVGTFDLAASVATGWPVAAAIVGLAVVHDGAHALAAARYGMPLSLPLPLPSVLIGSYGTHFPLAGFAPNRTAVADFALAGPVAGLTASLVGFVAGLVLTRFGAADVAYPAISLTTLHSSLLPTLLTDLLLPSDPMAPTRAAFDGPSTQVSLHPLAVGSFVGMLANSLSALPLGRLDGGRAVAACYGRRAAGAVGLCAALSVVAEATANAGAPELLLLWGGTAFLPGLLSQGELPAIEEATQPPQNRTRVLNALLLLSLLCVMPAPQGDRAPVFAEQFAMNGLGGMS